MNRMKRFGVWLALALGAVTQSGQAQQMPQDFWFQTSQMGSYQQSQGTAMSTGLVFACDGQNNSVQVFTFDGAPVRTFGARGSGNGQFIGLKCLAVGPDGLLYCVDRGNMRIQVLQQDGTFVRKWGTNGSGDGQFNSPEGVAVSPAGEVFVVESIGARVQVFQTNGVFVRKWGVRGTLPSDFDFPTGIAWCGGRVYVQDTGAKIYTAEGTFVKKLGGPLGTDIAVSPDGLIVANANVYDGEGTQIGTLTGAAWGATMLEDGTACGIVDLGTQPRTYGVRTFRRIYRTPGPLAYAPPPLPHVIAAEQRGGMPYLDIDYEVLDADSSNVTVAALAFVDGGNDLTKLLRLNTLVEGTATNLGPGVAANQSHHLTWNVGADWSTNMGNVKIEVLASDGRGMLDFQFVTIPRPPGPDVVLDRSPLAPADLLSCWYWLVATNDAAISVVSGKVVGVGGTYDGKILAQTADTTADGRAFLFERLHVREATLDEVAFAKAGSVGVTNAWATRVAGDRRKAVNEFGIDTGNWGASAWFVAPLP